MNEYLEDITLYIKEKNKYNIIHTNAHIRKIETTNKELINKYIDNVIARVPNTKIKVNLNDTLVLGFVDDEIIKTPLSTLKEKYGDDNVFNIQTVVYNIFDTDLDHIRIGLK